MDEWIRERWVDKGKVWGLGDLRLQMSDTRTGALGFLNCRKVPLVSFIYTNPDKRLTVH